MLFVAVKEAAVPLACCWYSGEIRLLLRLSGCELSGLLPAFAGKRGHFEHPKMCRTEKEGKQVVKSPVLFFISTESYLATRSASLGWQ